MEPYQKVTVVIIITLLIYYLIKEIRKSRSLKKVNKTKNAVRLYEINWFIIEPTIVDDLIKTKRLKNDNLFQELLKTYGEAYFKYLQIGDEPDQDIFFAIIKLSNNENLRDKALNYLIEMNSEIRATQKDKARF